jgi:hypothetical protein
MKIAALKNVNYHRMEVKDVVIIEGNLEPSRQESNQNALERIRTHPSNLSSSLSLLMSFYEDDMLLIF